MQVWDRNAPLPIEDDKLVDWTAAQEMVLSAYAEFSPEMAEIAKQFFTKSWIDAAVKPGKAPGAFAHPTVPSAHPYLLVNYHGKARDVMTLAHELGHFKHRHILKMMTTSFAMSLLGLAVLGFASQQIWFYTGLGVMPSLTSGNEAVALLLFMLVVPVFTFLLAPISSAKA